MDTIGDRAAAPDARMAPENNRNRRPLEIVIQTDGNGNNSLVYLNGVLQGNLYEFNVSLRGGRFVKIGGQYKGEGGRAMPFAWYGPGDVEKFKESSQSQQHQFIGSQHKES